MFLFTLILVLLMAINYQSNLIYGLTFWLGTLFVVTIHFTHANLSGLKVMAMGAQPSFAGKQADFVLRLSGEGRARHCVRVSWVASELPVQREMSPEDLACEVNVLADRVAELSLPYPLVERGWCTPGRLRIETDYPLGLLRCWSFLTLDQRAMAWPQPAPSDRSSLMSVDEGEGASQRLYPSDDQDLAGFRDYRPGDRSRLSIGDPWPGDSRCRWRRFSKTSGTHCGLIGTRCPLRTRSKSCHSFAHWRSWRTRSNTRSDCVCQARSYRRCRVRRTWNTC